MTQNPANQHFDLAATYLESQPDRLWAAEKDTLALAKAPAVFNWSDFQAFLQNNFTSLPL